MRNNPYINDIKKFIHIHIPKTGGTSLSSMIGTTGGHCRLSDIIDEGINISEYFKFTIVRNPFSRLVSFYYGSGIQKKQGFYWKNYLYKYKNFEEFVLECLPYYKIGSDNITHIEPQTWWVSNKKGDILIDYIGKFEEYNESCNMIMKRIGVTSKIKHLNKSNHGDYRKYYTNEMVDILNDFYQTDIKNFDYNYE